MCMLKEDNIADFVQDRDMYCEETDTPAVARTSNLNEELGQVRNQHKYRDACLNHVNHEYRESCCFSVFCCSCFGN